MRLPDPTTSRVILIGTACYEDPDIPDLPAVAANVSGLVEILTDPALGGLAAASCRSFVDIRADEVWQVADLASQAEDVLLIYFAGHGLLSDDGGLLLGMKNTKNSYAEFTALHVDQLARALQTSRAKVRLLILDCCYSERALQHMGTPAQQLVIEGTYTLASAPANRSAIAPRGERYTAFTGELISLMQAGDPSEAELLSVAAIFRRLLQTLQVKGYPTPKQANSGTASHLALVRNTAFRANRPKPTRPQILSAVDLRRTVLQAHSAADERLAALDSLIQQARSDENAVEELELLAVNGYVPILLRLGCIYALDILQEKSRATAAATTLAGIRGTGQKTVDLLRILMVPLVETHNGILISKLSKGPDARWGRQVADVLAGIEIPIPETFRAVRDLAALGCHSHALALLRAFEDQPARYKSSREEIAEEIRQIEGEAAIEDPSWGAEILATHLRYPIKPLLGEPPLTLFIGKRTIVLTPGAMIDRFGLPTGNVTYALGTPFPNRSIVPAWANLPYRAYQVVTLVDALTGTAIPWFGQPGGGTAFVLSASIADLIDAGAIHAIDVPMPPLADTNPATMSAQVRGVPELGHDR
jgi:nicrotizing toxin Mtb-like protein/caspase domain-containing protein